MNILESGQDRKIAALTINIHVHHLFWSDIVDDNKYMKMALTEAEKAYKKNEIPVGAVVVFENKVIGKGHNLKDSTGIVTNHAEIIAIQKANKKINDWRLNDATIYVTLEPCPMCASAIQQSRISKIVYGASSNKKHNKNINDLILNNEYSNHQVSVIKSDLADECERLLNSFFEKLR